MCSSNSIVAVHVSACSRLIEQAIVTDEVGASESAGLIAPPLKKSKSGSTTRRGGRALHVVMPPSMIEMSSTSEKYASM
jgi:hypothetical protein